MRRLKCVRKNACIATVGSRSCGPDAIRRRYIRAVITPFFLTPAPLIDQWSVVHAIDACLFIAPSIQCPVRVHVTCIVSNVWSSPTRKRF